MDRPFILTIDVDPGPESGSAAAADGLSTPRNFLRRLGNLAKEYGLRPTFLVSRAVAAGDGFPGLFSETGLDQRCEVGAYLPLAENPSFPEACAAEDVRASDELLEETFDALHRVVTARFGRPRSFRAGAWTLDGRLLRLLRRHGYRVDSSVTPGISWLSSRRPCYRDIPMRAYRLAADDARPGDAGPLEIPVSIQAESAPPWMESASRFSQSASASHARLQLVAAQRKMRPRAPVWLRPAFTTLEAMQKAASELGKTGYLHAMCRSDEGAGDTADAGMVFSRLEGLCRWARDKGYRPLTLSEAADTLDF